MVKRIINIIFKTMKATIHKSTTNLGHMSKTYALIYNDALIFVKRILIPICEADIYFDTQHYVVKQFKNYYLLEKTFSIKLDTALFFAKELLIDKI